MPFAALPWMSNSDQFLHAIIAGSQLAEERAARQARAASLGGGGRAPMTQQDAPPTIQPTDPHLAETGSILSVVDPSHQLSQDPTPTTPPQPFTAAGQQFITNPITGQAQPYVEPAFIEKVGDNLVKVNPKSFTASPIFQGGNGDGVRLSEVDSSGMDPTALQMAQMFNPPRLSGSPNAVSNYLHHATANPAGLPPKPDDRVKVKAPDGRTGNIPRAQLKEALANGYVEIK